MPLRLAGVVPPQQGAFGVVVAHYLGSLVRINGGIHTLLEFGIPVSFKVCTLIKAYWALWVFLCRCNQDYIYCSHIYIYVYVCCILSYVYIYVIVYIYMYTYKMGGMELA